MRRALEVRSGGRTTMKQAAAFFLFLSLLGPPGAASSNLIYLTATWRDSHLSDAAESLLREKGVVAGASYVDDTPMSSVDLPFVFMFGGERFRHAYLNANGGIFFDPAPPCAQYFAAGQPCSLTTSQAMNKFYRGYSNLIAVFVADFNPADSEGSRIMYAASHDRLLVRFENMPLYGSQWRGYTFTCEIREEGTIKLHLQSVVDPALVPDAPGWTVGEGWLVGLRFNAVQANRTSITPEQKRIQTTWQSGQGPNSYGVYVNQSAIANRTRVELCPMSTRWCLSPNNLSTARQSGAFSGHNITLSTATFGCDPGSFRFRCVFDRLGVKTYISPAAISEGNKSSPSQLTCPLPHGGLAPGGAYNVRIEYAASSSNGQGSAVVVSPLGWQALHDDLRLLFKSYSEEDNSSPGGGIDGACGVQGSDELDMACDSCGVCGGENTCFGCDQLHPYTDYDCNNDCDGSGFVDLYGYCCLRNETDCLGQCGGTFQEGWNGQDMLCCDDVDCFGLCSGSAWLDECDVCSGGQSNHLAESDKDCEGVCFGDATCAPTPVPSVEPSISTIPSKAPTPAPSHIPSSLPSSSLRPSQSPTNAPSSRPTTPPTGSPSLQPTPYPTAPPSNFPTLLPTMLPSAAPTDNPTMNPSQTLGPSPMPTKSFAPTTSALPTSSPSFWPTAQPSNFPTPSPTRVPSTSPSKIPSMSPSLSPTMIPSLTFNPTFWPTHPPVTSPSPLPLPLPTLLPVMAPTISPTRLPRPFPTFQPTVFPSQNNHPTWKPTAPPTHNPTVQPSLFPTLSPLIVARIETAFVLDFVSAADWKANESDNDITIAQALVATLSDDLLRDLSAVTSVDALPFVSDTAPGMPKEERGLRARQKRLLTGDAGKTLVLAEIDVVINKDVPAISSVQTTFGSLKVNLRSAVDDGTLGTGINESAKNLGAEILTAAAINVEASHWTIEHLTNITDVFVIHRYPTVSPTLTTQPSPPPSLEDPLTDNDATPDDNVNRGGWEKPNLLLLLVIGLEVGISIVLCACCLRLGLNNDRRDRDPLSLNVLAAQQRRGVLNGIIDPSTFGIHTARLREQYAAAVRALPQTKFRPQQQRERTPGEGAGDILGAAEGTGGAPCESRVIEGRGRSEEKNDSPAEIVKLSFIEDSCAICLMAFEVDSELEGAGDIDDTVKVLNWYSCESANFLKPIQITKHGSGHGFHPACLDEWLFRKNACPLCKRVCITSLDPTENNRLNPLTPQPVPGPSRMGRRQNQHVLPFVQGGMWPWRSGETGGNRRRAPRLQLRSLRLLQRRFDRPVTPTSSSDEDENGFEDHNDDQGDSRRSHAERRLRGETRTPTSGHRQEHDDLYQEIHEETGLQMASLAAEESIRNDADRPQSIHSPSTPRDDISSDVARSHARISGNSAARIGAGAEGAEAEERGEERGDCEDLGGGRGGGGSGSGGESDSGGGGRGVAEEKVEDADEEQANADRFHLSTEDTRQLQTNDMTQVRLGRSLGD